MPPWWVVEAVMIATGLWAPATEPPPQVEPTGYYDLALEISGDEVFAHYAVHIIECESSGNATAVGRAGERGLMQIHPVHNARFSHLDLFNPSDNIYAGWILYLDGGRAPWVHCSRTYTR